MHVSLLSFDAHVVQHAIAQNFTAFELASDKLREDRDYVINEAFKTDAPPPTGATCTKYTEYTKYTKYIK